MRRNADLNEAAVESHVPTGTANPPNDSLQTRRARWLYGLTCVTGLYGTLVGCWMLPMGLFVGPHGLMVAIAHMAIGAGLLYAASSLKINRPWAGWVAALLSCFVTSIASVAVFQSLMEEDYAALVFFGPLLGYFGGLTVLAFLFVWNSESRRFTLRSLLVASTIIALVCAAAAFLLRVLYYAG